MATCRPPRRRGSAGRRRPARRARRCRSAGAPGPAHWRAHARHAGEHGCVGLGGGLRMHRRCRRTVPSAARLSRAVAAGGARTQTATEALQCRPCGHEHPHPRRSKRAAGAVRGPRALGSSASGTSGPRGSGGPPARRRAPPRPPAAGKSVAGAPSPAPRSAASAAASSASASSQAAAAPRRPPAAAASASARRTSSRAAASSSAFSAADSSPSPAAPGSYTTPVVSGSATPPRRARAAHDWRCGLWVHPRLSLAPAKAARRARPGTGGLAAAAARTRTLLWCFPAEVAATRRSACSGRAARPCPGCALRQARTPWAGRCRGSAHAVCGLSLSLACGRAAACVWLCGMASAAVRTCYAALGGSRVRFCAADACLLLRGRRWARQARLRKDPRTLTQRVCGAPLPCVAPRGTCSCTGLALPCSHANTLRAPAGAVFFELAAAGRRVGSARVLVLR